VTWPVRVLDRVCGQVGTQLEPEQDCGAPTAPSPGERRRCLPATHLAGLDGCLDRLDMRRLVFATHWHGKGCAVDVGGNRLSTNSALKRPELRRQEASWLRARYDARIRRSNEPSARPQFRTDRGASLRRVVEAVAVARSGPWSGRLRNSWEVMGARRPARLTPERRHAHSVDSS
jgi:hypothetical protein